MGISCRFSSSPNRQSRLSIPRDGTSRRFHFQRQFFRLDTTSCRDVVRPAVSVGRAPALDGFDLNGFDLSHLSNNTHDQYGYESYLDLPSTSQSDLDFLDNRVLPAANQFDHFFDNLAHNNDGVFEDSHFDEFLNHDDQPAPEVQSSDSLAEKTTSLQPPFGASTFGCDDGSNAVSV